MFDLKDKCHLLVFGASLLMASVILLYTLFQPLGVLADDAEPAECSVSATGSYHSPQCCSQCHPGNYQAWSQTSHAAARVDPLYVVDLQHAEDPGECYRCHTTGYDANSHRYALAGVTCEACHKPYQPGHTAATMAALSPIELCGDCHIQTMQAWKVGTHGESDHSCSSCHPPHS